MSKWKRPYLWAIDTGRSRAGFAFLSLETGRFQTNAVQFKDNALYSELPDNATRYRATEVFAARMADVFPPAAIAYENPTGKHHVDLMHQAVGAIRAGVESVTGMETFDISVTAWKKFVLGHYQADQELLKVWAATLGYACEDLEQLAALAVAVFAAAEWFPAEFDKITLQPIHKEA